MARDASTDEIDDIFRPTLSTVDDVVGFRRPWDPLSLWFASFFGGPFTAAILFGLNGVRLGLPRLGAWAAVGFTVVGLVAAIVMLMYPDEEMDTRTARNAMRVVGVVVGAIGWRLQRKRFRMYSTAGGEPGKALLPSLGAIGGAFAIQFVIAFVYVAVTGLPES